MLFLTKLILNMQKNTHLMVEIRFDIEDFLTVELIYLNHTIALYRYMLYEYYLSSYICELF